MRRLGIFKTTNLIVPVMLALLAAAPLRVLGTDPVETDRGSVNLSRAIQFKTISYQDESKVDAEEFKAFHRFLEEAYPLIHKTLTREVIGDLGLLYTWKGSDPNAEPIVLMAHIDVVPIADGTVKDWTHPPFEGRIAEGYIWGRGTMDCKGILITLMEAVEGLLAKGYTPKAHCLPGFRSGRRGGRTQGRGANCGSAQGAQSQG